MKNLSTLLGNGNLTPRERVTLRVHDEVKESMTGVGSLTDADLYALTNGWTPKGNGEAREYNMYNDGWNMEGHMRIDMQSIAMEAQNHLLRSARLVDSAFYGKKLHPSEIFRKVEPVITEEEVLNLLLENTGLEYKQVIHRLTFQNISKALQADILAPLS